MIDDIEKTRAQRTMHLEVLNEHLREQLAAIKADERWVPKLGSELVAGDQSVRLTLAFGGKRTTALFTYDFLSQRTAVDATTDIIQLAFQNLINDRIREVVQPEVERLQASVKAIDGAGKW